MTKAYVLRKWASEQGLHPSDLLVEIGLATLVAGTVEVPTSFANGNIVGILAMRADNATVHATTGAHAYTSDLVVTNGAVTISSTVNTYTDQIFYVIIARTSV